MAQIVGNLEGLGHKFLNDFRCKPCGTQTHINFRRFQIFRLCFKQRLCIDSEFRVRFSGKLCSTQLCAHIAGKVFIRHLPSCFRVGRVSIGIFENNAGQFVGNLRIFAGCAEKFCHIGQVYLTMFANQHGKRFTGRIHTGNDPLRPNGALSEHVCL